MTVDASFKAIRRNRQFLKGPVSWNWIVRASELPYRALEIGLCIWRLSGITKGRPVLLGNRELEPFGIDRPTKSRGLRALEAARLIKVQRKHGSLPTVTLLDGA